MTKRLPGLEALRGIAALIVAYNHAAYFSGYGDFGKTILVRGHVSVDLFFMLSGFVLARAFESRMPQSLDFLIMRFKRLWLLLVIGVALGGLHFAMQGLSAETLMPYLVFGLILPMIGYQIALNPPAWSIFFELLANWFHAAILKDFGMASLIAVSLVCAIVMLPYLGAHGTHMGHEAETFWLGVPRVIMSYSLGIVLYRWNGDRERISIHFAWPLLLLFPLLVGLISQADDLRFELLFVIIVSPVMMLGALSLPYSRLACKLGAISFPLYAVHAPVQWMVLAAGGNFIVAFLVSIAAGLGVGLAFDANCRRTFGFLPRPITANQPQV